MTGYLVGVGIADITGEAGGVPMMGYAMPFQRTAGIHQRQWARAFVVAEPQPGGQRIAFVIADLGMIFTGVHQEVLRRLAGRFGDRYTAGNTLLCATHTHSGPGGHSHHTLYNLTIGGFRPRTFEAIVAGIVNAITRADDDLAPGELTLATGELHGASVNRSLPAFERNPAADKRLFPAAIDPQMSVLRFDQGGVPVGALTWFATHGTSMPNTNRLISGDNKGYAAYVWENSWAPKEFGDDAVKFVAGFPQSNPGDMSPNLGAGSNYGPVGDPFENTRVIGERQARKARELFAATGTTIAGPIDFRQRYVDFSHVEIRPEFAVDGPTRTWPAVLGQSMAAGTFDGLGPRFAHQGEHHRRRLYRVIDRLVVEPPAELIAGHAPKPPMLATGICQPHPWTPQILPIQVLRIGQLIIIAGPGEFTINSGLRIRRSVTEALGGLAEHVIFTGYANAYAGYVTTPEEYDAQLYEGASTHFGRATLAAYQQELAQLADDLRTGTPSTGTLEPPDLSGRQHIHNPAARLPDTAPPGRRIGDVIAQPAPTNRTGDVVTASFYSACPNNDTRNGSTFCEVQFDTADGWQTIADDNDWTTVFHWKRLFLTVSRARISWTVPRDAPAGTYRIVHHADARDRTGAITPITGATEPFHVMAAES
ncbi:neutral ceramidase [Mycobacteroides chelonae]|nr:neutral ceramidase [Mycobacteroides chelonae]